MFQIISYEIFSSADTIIRCRSTIFPFAVSFNLRNKQILREEAVLSIFRFVSVKLFMKIVHI